MKDRTVKIKLFLERFIKWPLLLLVFLLIVVNYFAFRDVMLEIVAGLNTVLKGYGYYFDVTKPVFFIFDWMIPGLGIFGYIIKAKNVFAVFQQIYDKITMIQLLILIVVLPILLLLQNKFYGKSITNGTK